MDQETCRLDATIDCADVARPSRKLPCVLDAFLGQLVASLETDDDPLQRSLGESPSRLGRVRCRVAQLDDRSPRSFGRSVSLRSFAETVRSRRFAQFPAGQLFTVVRRQAELPRALRLARDGTEQWNVDGCGHLCAAGALGAGAIDVSASVEVAREMTRFRPRHRQI